MVVKLKGQPPISGVILVMEALTPVIVADKIVLNNTLHQDWYMECCVPIPNRQMHTSNKGNGELQPPNILGLGEERQGKREAIEHAIEV